MAEQDLQQPQALAEETANAGARLRQAREQLGLSRADIAARTKIAERHLAAIEEERFTDLASSTYAVGFSRAYARAVGLDEREIARLVRGELDTVDDAAPPAPTFEPGDPARVPSSRTAWLAGIGVLAAIAGVLVLWRSFYFPAASLPDLTEADAGASRPAVASPTPTAAPGQVVITAREPGVWVKVSDASGKQLFQKQMARGESYAVPLDAVGPQLRTARPDALAIAIDGRPVPPLADRGVVLTAPVSAAALRARPSATPPAPAAAMAAPASSRPAASVPAAPAPTASAPTAAVPTAPAAPARHRPSPSAASPAGSPSPAARPSPQPRPSATAPATPQPATTPAAETPRPAPAASMTPASVPAAAAAPEVDKPSTVSQ
jgi:cytoskeletal protein RodZ